MTAIFVGDCILFLAIIQLGIGQGGISTIGSFLNDTGFGFIINKTRSVLTQQKITNCHRNIFFLDRYRLFLQEGCFADLVYKYHNSCAIGMCRYLWIFEFLIHHGALVVCIVSLEFPFFWQAIVGPQMLLA